MQQSLLDQSGGGGMLDKSVCITIALLRTASGKFIWGCDKIAISTISDKCLNIDGNYKVK